MENFVVSARKYRPQTFDTVVGQEHVTTTLKNAIAHQQLAHAFLFCGPRGVGKTTCARILAKTINCEHLQEDGEACNTCSSCKSFNAGTSLNIHELDAASNNSVDDIRSLVEQVRFAPQGGKYKVYIVDEVHMLSSSAFNAFLKTLEEPPHYAIFILATTEKHKILPTILSRCQIFDFKRITNDDTVHHLKQITEKEHIEAETAALQVIADKSEGCMRDSLSILDKIVSFTNGKVTYQNTLEHLNILDHDYYFKLLAALTKQDLATAMLLYDEINRKGFEGDIFLNGFQSFVRNLLVCKDEKALALLDVVASIKPHYQASAKEVSLSFLVSALNILNEAELNYKSAKNKRLTVELALVKLNYLQQAISFAEEEKPTVKKKSFSGPIAIRQHPIVIHHVASEKQQSSVRKQDDQGAKLYIEQGAELPEVQLREYQKATIKQEKIVDEEPGKPNKPVVGKKSKQSLLDSLREKYQGVYTVDAVEEAEPLYLDKLQEIWNNYTEELSKQSKDSAANAFHLSRLAIVDENLFEVKVESFISRGFIERERVFILDEIQKKFANRSIRFEIKIENEEKLYERPLTAQEKLEKMASINPHVKALIDALSLVYK